MSHPTARGAECSTEERKQDMSRPSIAAERTEQIMGATRACLLQYGLAGTTLERVALESGLSRSHVRYFVGNREDLLRLFADWLFVGFESGMDDLMSATEPPQRLSAVIDYLFGTGFLPISDDDAAVRELITAGLNDEKLRDMLQSRYNQALGLIAGAVRDSIPGVTAKQARTLAYGIWSLALGNSTLAEIGLPEASGPTPRWAVEALVAAMTPRA